MKKIGISIIMTCVLILSACSGSKATKLVCTTTANGTDTTFTITGDKNVDEIEMKMHAKLADAKLDKDGGQRFIDASKESVKAFKGIAFDGEIDEDEITITNTFTIDDLDDAGKDQAATSLTSSSIDFDTVTPKELSKILEDRGYSCK